TEEVVHLLDARGPARQQQLPGREELAVRTPALRERALPPRLLRLSRRRGLGGGLRPGRGRRLAVLGPGSRLAGRRGLRGRAGLVGRGRRLRRLRLLRGLRASLRLRLLLVLLVLLVLALLFLRLLVLLAGHHVS